jgi:hypothetical protein
MAVTINASTSAGLVMTSDLSGVLTLQQNGTAVPLNRAWVNLYDNGTTVTNNGSYNVASITRNATCDWTINFTTALSSATYSVVGVAGLNTTAMRILVIPWNTTSPTTTAFRIQAVTSDGVLASNAYASISVFL